LSKYEPGETEASRKDLRHKIKSNINAKIQEKTGRFCTNNLKTHAVTARSLGRLPSLIHYWAGKKPHGRMRVQERR